MPSVLGLGTLLHDLSIRAELPKHPPLLSLCMPKKYPLYSNMFAHLLFKWTEKLFITTFIHSFITSLVDQTSQSFLINEPWPLMTSLLFHHSAFLGPCWEIMTITKWEPSSGAVVLDRPRPTCITFAISHFDQAYWKLYSLDFSIVLHKNGE